MAELPELETVRRELEKEAVGKRFKAPEVTGTKVIKHNGTKKVFQSRLEGAKVKSVDRKGRHLVGNLDNGELLVLGREAGGRVHHPERDVGVGQALARRLHHALAEQVVRLVQPGRVDEEELRRRPALDPEDAVPRRLRLRRDDRELPPEDAVQQRRLADVRPSHQRDEAGAVLALLARAGIRRVHITLGPDL